MAEKYIICSGKGGCGKSTVTVGTAASLAAKGKKVLCADADTAVRSLDMLLGPGENILFNWYDAAKGNCKKTDAVYGTAYKGVSLLPAPRSADDLTYDEFYELILFFEDKYDYILFDAENCGTAFDFAAKTSKEAIIVTTPDAVSLRSACDKAEKMRLFADKTRLIVNKVIRSEMEEGRQTKLNDCVDISSVRLLGVVPYDTSAVSLGSGGKLSGYIVSAFSRIAERICGKNIPFSPKNF